MALKQFFKNHYILYKAYYAFFFGMPSFVFGRNWDIYATKRKFRQTFGRPIDLKNPKTLNEKIQWLKLNERKEYHTRCADKLAVREIWKQYGKEGLIPLLYQTDDWRKMSREKLPDIPCVIKCNTGSGCYKIVRDKKKLNDKKLQKECRRWLVLGKYFYAWTQEWQYKNVKPCILVEQLLLDHSEHIPNDYKLHYINGELQFVYCSIDREGQNYRSIYSPKWERIDMEWVNKRKHKGFGGKDIPCPETFPRMQEIGQKIAQDFKYVRVDFYDVDGKLYYGEITLHHGSGYDTFEPEWYDTYYGSKLKL